MQIGDTLVCQTGKESKKKWQFNTNDNKTGLQSIVKVRKILEHFSLKMEEALRTASNQIYWFL